MEVNGLCRRNKAYMKTIFKKLGMNNIEIPPKQVRVE